LIALLRCALCAVKDIKGLKCTIVLCVISVYC
jgi:hypothetical protein